MTTRPRILVVTNFCTHYRAPLYELLHQRLGAEFVFFTEGTEKYWQAHLGVTSGSFPRKTLARPTTFGTGCGLNTALLRELWTREYDVMIKCMNGRVELPAAFIAAQVRRRPFVLWTGMWMHPRTFFHRLSHPFAKLIYCRSDAIVTYGDHVSRFVIEEGADASKVFPAENATALGLFGRPVSEGEAALCRDRHALGDGPVVLAVSRLVAQKGLEYLIEAVGMLDPPRPVLAVVGTGDLAETLSALASSRSVELRLVGGLKPGELAPLYSVAGVFVMPSITTRTIKETWGLACNEAMSQGVPVIATDAVGAAAGGLVVDGKTGIVVPERDSHAVAHALRRLLSEPGYAARRGDNGRERVQKTNYSNMADGFERAVTHAVTHRRALRGSPRQSRSDR